MPKSSKKFLKNEELETRDQEISIFMQIMMVGAKPLLISQRQKLAEVVLQYLKNQLDPKKLDLHFIQYPSMVDSLKISDQCSFLTLVRYLYKPTQVNVKP